MSTVSNVPIDPTGNLKPGRIGLTHALVDRGSLKPGRIGLRLQKLPGWELATGAEVETLWRTFRFHRTDTAQAFAAFAARAADEHGQRPVISQVWNQVTVSLTGAGSLSDAALDFAEILMLLPAAAENGGSTVEPLPGEPGAEAPGPVVQPGPTAQPTPPQPTPPQPEPTAPTGIAAPPVVQPSAVGRS